MRTLESVEDRLLNGIDPPDSVVRGVGISGFVEGSEVEDKLPLRLYRLEVKEI